MKIAIASDHRGYELKKELIDYLKINYEIDDLGTDSTESTDYPIYGIKLAEKVAKKEYEFGIVICGTGIGISIACNKVKGIRCAKVDSVNDARLTRNDNDANIISINGSTNLELAKEYIDTFLTTPKSLEEKHIRRVNIIKEYEESHYAS